MNHFPRWLWLPWDLSIHIYLSQVILLILVDRPFKKTKTEIPVANPKHILYMKSDNVKY
jgi:hypothetical protein